MRKEAEDNRKLLADYAAKIKAFEDEKLSADERLKRDLADYQRQTLEQQRQIQELRVRNAVEVEALRMGFYSPDDAYLHLNAAKLDFDSEGRPLNVSDLLKELADNRKYLVKPPEAAPAPATQPAAPKPAPAPKPAGPAVPPTNPGTGANGKMTLEEAKRLGTLASRGNPQALKEYTARREEIQALMAEEAKKARNPYA